MENRARPHLAFICPLRLLLCFTAVPALVPAFGCGVESTADDAPGTISHQPQQRGALTSTQSYLVSFASGAIPGNAALSVNRAGGVVVARYATVGALLARSSSPSFATLLRGTAGVTSVGATTAAFTALGPVKGPSAAQGRRRQPPPAAAGDPLSFRQWDMEQIRAPQARAISSGKRSVLVGVIDTGIDITHPDLVGQVDAAASVSCVGGIADPMPAAWSNDAFGHGTHVAGIIAAKKNGVGVVGVAPGVTLGAIKVVNDDGLILPEAFVCGIDWAASHGFDVLNASFNIDPFASYCSDDLDQQAIVETVRRAISSAAHKKVSLVSATNNTFTDLAHVSGATSGSTCRELPVQLPRVIGVSAVGPTRQLAFYSNYGFGAVDVTAPGGDSLLMDANGNLGQVLSSVPPNSLYYQLAAEWDGQVQDCTSGTCSTYAYLQGTSQAAPHVAGVAALLISRYGKMSPQALAILLSLRAQPLPCPPNPYNPAPDVFPTAATCVGPPFYNNFYGAGEVDALAAVR
ncbi:MAG: S8 family serine peptidase [Polyangia bacterium]